MARKRVAKATEPAVGRGAGQPSWALSPYTIQYSANGSMTYGRSSAGIVRGNPADWFGPLNPIAPIAPREVAGRQFDFTPGYNLNLQPRAYEPIGFPELKALAQCYDLLRTVIETRKDEVERLRWTIRPQDKGLRKPSATVPPEMLNRIDALKTFWTKPDGFTPWGTWLRMLLEDLYVIDAPSLYCQRTRSGKLFALLPMDGATIKRVIDDWGRTPMPYTENGAEVVPPAYQQILKGLPAVDYSVRDMIYRPRNPRPGKVYGYSPVEQILMTVNIALRRQVWQLSYYSEGNIPEMMIGVPDNWTPQQIKDYQAYFDTYFTGDLAARRRAKFVPGAMAKNVQQTKDPQLMNAFDEWLARVVCFAFGVSPQPFVAMMNRATADSAAGVAEETGLQPSKQWVKGLVDGVNASEFNSPDLELVFEEEEEIDQEKQQKILTGYSAAGLLTINQAREKMGEEPYDSAEFPAADQPMLKTATGYVPIGTNTIEGKQAMIDAGLALDPVAAAEAAAATAAAGGGGAPGGDGGKPGGFGGGKPKPGAEKDPAEKRRGHQAHAIMTRAFAKAARRGKTRRLLPVPFDRPDTRKARVAVRSIFFKLFKTIAPRVAGQVRAALAKVGKAEETDEEIAARIARELDLDLFEVVFNKVADELEAVARKSNSMALAQLGVEDRGDLFNQVNEKAVEHARERAAELLGMRLDENGDPVPNPNAEWAVTDSTRDMVRDIIAGGLEDNIGGDDIADLIESSAGFSQDRADMIARTEIANANSRASREGYEAARDEGVNVKKEWALGPNPCPICEDNAAAGPIDVDEEFPSGDQEPTAHPFCECALIPVVVEDPPPADE